MTKATIKSICDRTLRTILRDAIPVGLPKQIDIDSLGAAVREAVEAGYALAKAEIAVPKKKVTK